MEIKKRESGKILFLVKARQGSRCRYRYDDRILRLESMLPEDMVYPEDYGIVLRTSSKTGEPLDGFMLTKESLEPGSIIEARPIACIRTQEEEVRNDKVILVPEDDPGMKDLKDFEDMGAELRMEIKGFINDLYELKGEEAGLKSSLGPEETKRLIKNCKKIYKRRNG